MTRLVTVVLFFFVMPALSSAQAPKGITIEEYEKAKTFVVKNLDDVTYAKFDNNSYVLDKYETKKPYIIKGDDGVKKRIDLYALLDKADGRHLGTVIYYTNEKGKLYTACLPGNFADAKVWEKYFEDIHAIDKEEKNFVLRLSYVLSKEYSYQAYKSTLKGKETDRSESGTYGMEICFPGDEEVLMANGSKKLLLEIKPGDEVMTVDPITNLGAVVKVNKLVEHEAKNYAITSLTLIAASEKIALDKVVVDLDLRQLEATPNHPVMTKEGISSIGAVKEGQELYCLNNATGSYEWYKVWYKVEKAKGLQKVYNIEAAGGTTFIMSGVMVMQKHIK